MLNFNVFAILGSLFHLHMVSCYGVPFELQEKLDGQLARETRNTRILDHEQLDKAFVEVFALESLAKAVAEEASRQQSEEGDKTRLVSSESKVANHDSASQGNTKVANQPQVQLSLSMDQKSDLVMHPEFNVTASDDPYPLNDYENPDQDAVLISSPVESANVDYNEDTGSDLNDTTDSSSDTLSNLKNQNKILGTIPTIDANSLRSTLVNVFGRPRHDSTGNNMKDTARNEIIRRFSSYGLETFTHNFTGTTIPRLLAEPPRRPVNGLNIVGILPGRLRGNPSDAIVLIGAHYDTVSTTSGVDDNGSGMSVMMEIARTLTRAKCEFEHTVMFVAFDQEERGVFGSSYFVKEYLIPVELQGNKSHFQGAYILDTILNFDTEPHSQIIPRDFQRALPSLSRRIARNGYRGDFLAMISRKGVDSRLTQYLTYGWSLQPYKQHKLYGMATGLPATSPTDFQIIAHTNFLRSDHLPFWYHKHESYKDTLIAVLLTDTGPFRGRMRTCYHRGCDNVATFVTSKNIRFAKHTADSLVIATLELGEGTCPGKSQK